MLLILFATGLLGIVKISVNELSLETAIVSTLFMLIVIFAIYRAKLKQTPYYELLDYSMTSIVSLIQSFILIHLALDGHFNKTKDTGHSRNRTRPSCGYLCVGASTNRASHRLTPCVPAFPFHPLFHCPEGSIWVIQQQPYLHFLLPTLEFAVRFWRDGVVCLAIPLLRPSLEDWQHAQPYGVLAWAVYQTEQRRSLKSQLPQPLDDQHERVDLSTSAWAWSWSFLWTERTSKLKCSIFKLQYRSKISWWPEEEAR